MTSYLSFPPSITLPQKFFLIPDAGHSAKEPGITDKLIYATDKFRSITS
jgi:hypothetical protein